VAGHTLDFREERVAALLVQAMWQTGPFTNGSEYTWEENFQGDDKELVQFACKALEELAECVADNWDAATQLCSTIIVGLRIFEGTKGDACARELLRRCSVIASRWIAPAGPMAVARDQLLDLSEQQQQMDERITFVASLVVLAYRPEESETKVEANKRVQSLLLAANITSFTTFEDPKCLQACVLE
jgi:hypothetical protein